jgi:acid phosphatase family membrane protein YuiD
MKLNLFSSLQALLVHPTFWVTGAAWLSACLLKVILLKLRTGAYHWDRFFGTGGMPSSHTAFAAGLTVSAGVSEGFSSAVCGLALGVTILTAVDATGLRRSAGLQAERINHMMTELYKGRKIHPPRLKETLGHTLPEVLAGASVGAVVAFLLYPSKP